MSYVSEALVESLGCEKVAQSVARLAVSERQDAEYRLQVIGALIIVAAVCSLLFISKVLAAMRDEIERMQHLRERYTVLSPPRSVKIVKGDTQCNLCLQENVSFYAVQCVHCVMTSCPACIATYVTHKDQECDGTAVITCPMCRRAWGIA